MELSITLRENDPQPLYEQIYTYIRDEIRTGRLRSGEKLPSSRVLSRNLHLARSTVEHAYDQLLAEGYIRAKKNSGFYVCGLDAVPETVVSAQEEDASRPMAGRVPGKDQPVPGQTAAEKSRTAGAGRKQAGQTDAPGGTGEGSCIDFSLRKVDMSGFPYATWRRIVRELMSGDNSAIFERGEAQGEAGFRETIARYLHLSRGVVCDPSQVIVGAGNDYLLMLLCSILRAEHPGQDQIAMENPTYLRAFRVFRSMEEAVVAVRQDESGMSAAALEESGCRIAYCMPAHQYPTGRMMPFTRRMELLLWADRAHDRYLIEDDYDSEFRYRGRPVPALQSLDRNGKVIYLGTFSKSIAPAIRVSYMILPDSLLRIYQEKFGFVSQTVSRIDQRILDDFIRPGYFERYLNRMRNRYRLKHDRLLEALSPLAARFEVSGADAGLHLILSVKEGWSVSPDEIKGIRWERTTEEEKRLRVTRLRPVSADRRQESGTAAGLTEKLLQAAAQKNGVVVYTMHELCLPDYPLPEGQADQAQILLGFAAVREEDLTAGVSRLCRAWNIAAGLSD